MVDHVRHRERTQFVHRDAQRIDGVDVEAEVVGHCGGEDTEVPEIRSGRR